MATARANSSCNLVQVGILELKEAGPSPVLTGLMVLYPDMVMVLDTMVWKLCIYSLQDGHLLAVYNRLMSRPRDMCICNIHDNEIQIAVGLWDTGQIEILTIKSTGQAPSIKWVRTLNINSEFDECQGVTYSNDKLLISGKKQDSLCWGIVSITDGHVDMVHKICKCGIFSVTYLATSPRDNAVVYISCWAGDCRDKSGVYGYKSSKWKFFFQHDDLNDPRDIVVDAKGYIFVCNQDPASIHQLTEKGQLVTIYKEGIPSVLQAMFWEEQQGLLYVTNVPSNKITIYRPMYSGPQDTSAVPAEILRMNDKSTELFKEALRHGEERVYNIRVMVVGQFGVGKTTLIKRLLGKEVDINEKQSTEGIIVHVHCCRVSPVTFKWTLNTKDSEQNLRLQRLAKVLNDKFKKRNSNDMREEEVEFIETGEKKAHNGDVETKPDHASHSENGDVETKPDHASHLENANRGIPNSSDLDKFPSNQMVNLVVEDTKSDTSKVIDDPVVEILKLLQDKAEELKQETDENVPLTILDFAGQFAFYTTHQTFLTERAIYLLVSNVSEQVTDPVKDDCYFDTEGIKLCKVYELVEVWLNSIHSCAPNPEADIPPVILVGTHTDKIPQESRKELCENYFRQIRSEYLGDKPTIVHLADEDFAIDNTVTDQKLEDLKKKIVQLASEQPYWGEVIPARWLPLEERLMTLKDAGVKVIPYSLLEKMNQEGTINIESREELDLFLRFQHDIGNILYFGTKELKEQIMLDPQWLIHALRTLITAEDFILKKVKKPAVIRLWREFSKTGKLTQELIDAIWTKEEHKELLDNKDHILPVMEKLNIITRPRSYSEDQMEVKVENYFLAPCMLRQTTPKEIISPEPHPEMESSSVLCCVFVEKFLPSPIFHRLLASCLAHWPVAKRKSENLIFCGCCVFDVDPCHRLTLYLRDHVIFARVSKMSLEKKTPDSKMCIYVKKFIDDNLLKIIGCLSQNLMFEWYIQCPKDEGDSLDSMFSISELQESKELFCSFHDKGHMVVPQDLLKFWVEDKKTQEQDGRDIAFSQCTDILDRKPSERDLGRLSMKIGKEFFVLALHLGLSSANIEQIRQDHLHTVTQCLMILAKWRQESRDKATFRNLETAFRSADIDIDILTTVTSAGESVPCLPPRMLDMQPEERHLNQLCKGIGKEYVHLGVELGVPVSRIEQIRIGWPNDVSRQCFEIMNEWKQTKDMQATFRNLELAVRSVGIDPSILRQCFS